MKLSQAIDVYVRRRQGAGWRFDGQAKQLRSFLRQHGDAELRHITAIRVAEFLDGSGVRPSTWNQKRGTLKVFFEYWAVCGQVKTSPVPPNALKYTQDFVPYIFSQSELRRLLEAVPKCQRRSSCVMSAGTFRSLLLLLYGTGMRVGEALRLRLMDVNLELSMVTVRGTKFYKSRLVPLGRDVSEMVQGISNCRRDKISTIGLCSRPRARIPSDSECWIRASFACDGSRGLNATINRPFSLESTTSGIRLRFIG